MSQVTPPGDFKAPTYIYSRLYILECYTLGDLKWWPRVWNSTELRVLLIATSPLTSEPEFCRTKAEQRVGVDTTDGKGEVQSLTQQASAPGSGESAIPAPATVVLLVLRAPEEPCSHSEAA